MKSKKQRIIDAAESLGWNCTFEKQTARRYNPTTGKFDKHCVEKFVTFAQYSSAGEDFSFYVFYDSLDEIQQEVFDYYEGFDPEDHVSMWLEAKKNNVAGVPDVLTLARDASDIDDMLEDLFIALQEAVT